MDLTEKYENKLQYLEMIANNYYDYTSKEYENITAYFNLIRRGIIALKNNELLDEKMKNFQINSIDANFKELERKINRKKKEGVL